MLYVFSHKWKLERKRCGGSHENRRETNRIEEGKDEEEVVLGNEMDQITLLYCVYVELCSNEFHYFV